MSLFLIYMVAEFLATLNILGNIQSEKLCMKYPFKLYTLR